MFLAALFLSATASLAGTTTTNGSESTLSYVDYDVWEKCALETRGIIEATSDGELIELVEVRASQGQTAITGTKPNPNLPMNNLLKFSWNLIHSGAVQECDNSERVGNHGAREHWDPLQVIQVCSNIPC
jgi:hypothetical protein